MSVKDSIELFAGECVGGCGSDVQVRFMESIGQKCPRFYRICMRPERSNLSPHFAGFTRGECLKIITSGFLGRVSTEHSCVCVFKNRTPTSPFAHSSM